MRFKHAVKAVLGLAATLAVATAVPASAEGTDFAKPINGVKREQGFQAQTTDGNSFLEVNGAGNLVYWTRSGGSFSGEVRGWGWGGTRIVSSLNSTSFVEVKGDGRLSKWSWNGGGYVEQVVGWGWGNARLLSAVSSNQFIEINQQGDLALWTFDANNVLSKSTIGWGWGGTRVISGLGGTPLDFLEIKGDGRFSEWYDEGGLKEFPFNDTNFSQVRLLAGTDINHFLLIDAVEGGLYEFTLNTSTNQWEPAQRGWGWGGTRLIG
ncbi:hypothetical protein Lesp02_66160 [Lentzea sp. NBRC 105346]|uniref:hypothetical protein n=1 Tax=Lentzea sp. NBRC 105346 TaxID=3032205 RepID=UPI0024A17A4E|nr:hypothetical protein [Lentzea sp. NBRC 105346]GLZ34429.1 hypothetical protein Lesp02_66160 [Lentzea sp. NBRC 105346]